MSEKVRSIDRRQAIKHILGVGSSLVAFTSGTDLYFNLKKRNQLYDEIGKEVMAKGTIPPDDEALKTAQQISKRRVKDLMRQPNPGELLQQAKSVLDKQNKFNEAVQESANQKRDQFPSTKRIAGDIVGTIVGDIAALKETVVKTPGLSSSGLME